MNITRFYKNETPKEGDIVIVKIREENEYGYIGDLLE